MGRGANPDPLQVVPTKVLHFSPALYGMIMINGNYNTNIKTNEQHSLLKKTSVIFLNMMRFKLDIKEESLVI